MKRKGNAAKRGRTHVRGRRNARARGSTPRRAHRARPAQARPLRAREGCARGEHAAAGALKKKRRPRTCVAVFFPIQHVRRIHRERAAGTRARQLRVKLPPRRARRGDNVRCRASAVAQATQRRRAVRCWQRRRAAAQHAPVRRPRAGCARAASVRGPHRTARSDTAARSCAVAAARAPRAARAWRRRRRCAALRRMRRASNHTMPRCCFARSHPSSRSLALLP